MTAPVATPVLLRAAGTALVLDIAGPSLPTVLHWGADPGPLSDAELTALAQVAVPPVAPSALDAPWSLSLLPLESDGWSGTPGLTGFRPGGPAAVQLSLTEPVSVQQNDDESGGRIGVRAADARAQLAVAVDLVLEPSGVVRVDCAVTNTGDSRYDVASVRSLLPVPPDAAEVLDLTGRWCRERSPQRAPLLHGTRARQARRGRPGHDATLVLAAGTSGFGFRSGEVWGTSVAWSGDSEHLVERLPEGAGAGASVLGGGELLRAGEVQLRPGEIYRAPTTCFAWSGTGLDGLSHRLHRYLRARPRHPRSPRPVVLNTWEAVYFDHDLDRLRTLADVAARIGVERFVLDDGWFRHRRDDKAGLGDWYVDETVWPDGLHPIVDHVHGLGLQFGLWFEPEMVNPDSDLVRAHPEWVLTPGAREWRSQQVLDLANPEAFDHIFKRLDALTTEYRIDYIKWDHNRDLHVAVHRDADGTERPGIHEQTLALYRLLDRLREGHPGLEIESCASGGARVDLGILDHTDRIWASDSNDALERQLIQRWTALLVPLEMIGTHVGPPIAHTSGRHLPLSFRCASALFGHAGIEWDITGCTDEELATLAAWIELYKDRRALLHSGDVVRADLPDEGALLHGVVATDGVEALFGYVRLASPPDAVPGRVRLPGLDPDRRYVVRVADGLGAPDAGRWAGPEWVGGGPVTLSGSLLTSAGLAMPALQPASALVLDVRAT
jgi:alpha-galactosidase